MACNLPSHLENYLGLILRGWNTPPEADYSYTVAEFETWPDVGIKSYCTLGVSHHILGMPDNRSVRQEFLICSSQPELAGDIAGFLLRFSDMVLAKHQAILKGEVIGPRQPILAGCPMGGIYATSPEIFPEALHLYDAMSPHVVITWLIPVHNSEIAHIESHSSDAFEALLVEQDPKLWDLARMPVV